LQARPRHEVVAAGAREARLGRAEGELGFLAGDSSRSARPEERYPRADERLPHTSYGRAPVRVRIALARAMMERSSR
ncbi:MAG: hypothetical protein ACXVID_08795, partial [Thermoanaerobaculia bacterium]